MKKPIVGSDVGRHSYGGANCTIHQSEQGELSIGAFCSIGSNLTIMLGNGSHRPDWITCFPFGRRDFDSFGQTESYYLTGNKVIIENDVWIGANVTIMPNVRIGNGAIIAANSHVIKDVQDYEMVGGNPAKHIKYRFNPEIIELLLKFRWWDLPDDVIRINLKYIMAKPNEDTLKRLIDETSSWLRK